MVCPVGELCERAPELAFQAGDFGAIADALEPFQRQRHFFAGLPSLLARPFRRVVLFSPNSRLVVWAATAAGAAPR